MTEADHYGWSGGAMGRGENGRRDFRGGQGRFQKGWICLLSLLSLQDYLLLVFLHMFPLFPSCSPHALPEPKEQIILDWGPSSSELVACIQ